MNMENKIILLQQATDYKTIISILQDINKDLLTYKKIHVLGIDLYPIELESYFYKDVVFEDPYVHRNELQKNHFGELYVHRMGYKENSPYKIGNRVCVGLSLSDNDIFYYSVLIRSAVFNDRQLVFGPNKVLKHLADLVRQEIVKKDYCSDKNSYEDAADAKTIFKLLENKPVLQKADKTEDPRCKDDIISSTRVGLKSTFPIFQDMQLRTVIGKLSKEFQFKEKKKLIQSYIEQNSLLTDIL